METRPSQVIIVMALALIGALFALMYTIIRLDLQAEGFTTTIAFNLLLLAFFLAVAGSLNVNGQWSWRFLLFVQVLCAAIPAVSYINGTMDLLFCVIFIVIAGVMILLTTTNTVKRWIDSDRI